MQATTHSFDPTSGAGTVLLDDGRERPFSADVFAHSGLRLLRVGQRVSIGMDSDVITRLWVVGIGDGEPIH